MAEELSPEIRGLETGIQSKISKVREILKDPNGVQIPDPQELMNVKTFIKSFRREIATELPKGTAKTEATKRAKKYEQEARELHGEIERRKIGVSSSKGDEYVYDHSGAVEQMKSKDDGQVAHDTMKLQKNTQESLLRSLQMGAASSDLASETEQRLKEQSGQLNDLVEDLDDYNESIDHMNKQLKQVWKWIPRQLRQKTRKERDLRKQQSALLQKRNERATKNIINPGDGAALNAIKYAQRVNTNMDGKDGDQVVAQFEENDKRTDVLLKAVGDQIGTLKMQAENINIEISSQDAQLEVLEGQMDKAEDTGEKISNQFDKHGFGSKKAKKKYGIF